MAAGILDIVTADGSGDSISVLIGNSNGSFKAYTSYASDNGNRSLDLADLNQDGVLDVVTANYNPGTIGVLFGNRDGSFLAPTLINSFGGASGANIIALKDMNQDGIVDLINLGASTVELYLGNGDGSFRRGTSFAVGTDPAGVTIADFNNDGLLDLATSDAFTNTTSVILGNGNGSFKARVTLATPNNPRGIVSFDHNGDGNQDLVVTNYTNSRVTIFTGNGDGTFSNSGVLTTSSGPNIFDFGDFNRDGIMDLVTGDTGANVVSVFLGNGSTGVAALQQFSIVTKEEARDTLGYARSRIAELAQQREKVGAFESRLSSAVRNLEQSSLNYAEANSRIVDADVADESARLTAMRILQQSAAAVLAQANLQPRLALDLLGNI